MIFPVLIVLSACWTSAAGATSFYYEVQGSLLGIAEDERSFAAIETKFFTDVSSTTHRNDITLNVHELKSNFGVYLSSTIFRGFVTTSVSNRSELISLLQSVPTTAFAYVAPVDSIPSRPISSFFQSNANIQCVGDGIPLPNNTCLCPPYSRGSQCESVQCQNFGVWDGRRCSCPPGYYSKFCENRGFRPAIENDIDFSGRSLVIFFNLATSMQQDFQSFRANLATMVNGMQGSNNDIVSYVFYGFVLTNTNTLTYFIGGGRQLSSLNLIFDALVFSPPAQQQPLLYQIMLSPFVYSYPVSFSNVLVFVDSGAGDATAPNDLFSANTPEQQLMSSTKIWHNKLTFIVTQTSANPIDTSGDDFDVYRRLAESTHGDLFVIDKNEIPVVMTNVLANYQHIMENLAVRYRFNCNEMKMFGIPAEYDTTSQIRVLLTVDKNDGNPLAFERPYVTDMNNLELSYTSRGRYYALYDLPNGMNNIRMVSITPGLVCSLRVFFASANTMLLSHTNNPKMDIGFPVAYKNIPQLATGRPVGFSNFSYVEIRQFDSRTGFPLSVSTRGYRRGGDSTYTYEFDNLSDCTPGPFIQQVEIYYQGGVATRVLPGYCALPGPLIASNRRAMTAKSDVGDDGSQCAEMNFNAITDPRQHEFRQIVFAVENSAAMNNAAFILAQNIDMIITQMNKGKPERQFSLILFDDKDIRFVSSTYDADLFTNQFFDAMLQVMNNKITLLTSRSLDVVAKVPEISILSPTILYLFTSSPSSPSVATTYSLTRNLQVNVFTVRDGSNVLINDDLTYHQRSSGGRNLPVTKDGLPNLQDLLTSSVYENSIVLDKVAQDCSASVSIKFNVEDVATALVINVVGLDVETANMVLFSDPNVK
ncbi:hypothetical protein Aduo_000966 [Ancylostoma duodenale]